MRIEGVQALPLRIPFSEPFTIAAPSEQTRDHLEVLVVRLFSDDGLIGIGETQAWRRQNSAETLPGLKHIVDAHYQPRLVGRSPRQISAIMHDLNAAVPGNLYAQAAVGDALYDLVARSFDLPLCELLGGPCRSTVPVGMPLSISDTDALMSGAERLYRRGYRHLRVKIGMDPAQDLNNVRALREHFRDDVVLRADANGGMTYWDALRLLKRLEGFGLDIVEQPVAGWDLEGMSALCRKVEIPISGDESLGTDHSLIEIARRRAAAIVQTKGGKNGGIHYIRKLWSIADAAGIGIFPGNHPTTSIGAAAVAHLCAAWPELPIVGDFHAGACEWIEGDIVVSPLRVEDAHVQVPRGPGLGMEIDEKKLEKYRLDL